MKLNLRLVPPHELPLHGHSAFWYETPRPEPSDCTDFHLTLYKEEAISAWITMCPTDDAEVLQVCNRYVSEEEHCNLIENKALAYVEDWARNRGYKKVFVQACDVSVAFYKGMGYRSSGDTFYQGEALMHKMIKEL